MGSHIAELPAVPWTNKTGVGCSGAGEQEVSLNTVAALGLSPPGVSPDDPSGPVPDEPLLEPETSLLNALDN